ncbi:MAG: hypothetical protein Q9203_003466 [Teloschistes exilis]
MHHQALIILTYLLPLALATPLDLTLRNADHSNGKCSNGQEPPCSDAPLCFYDYGPFVGTFTCQGGTSNWQYCDAAIDIVCSTLAYNIAAADSEPYESNIGTSLLEGQGTECFLKASKGEGATANLAYDVCVQSFAGIKGCENNKQW